MGEEAYNAAKAIWTEYGMYFKEVENEYGSNMAFELHRRVYDKMGQGFAAMLKEQFGDEMNVEAIGSMFVESNIASGLPTEQIVESVDKVIHKNPDCSRYHGLKEAGFTDEDVEKFCDICEKAMKPHFASIGLEYTISEFSAPDGKCEEILVKIK